MILYYSLCLFYRLNEFTLQVELPLIKHALRVLLGFENGQLILSFKYLLEAVNDFSFFLFKHDSAHFLNHLTKIL